MKTCKYCKNEIIDSGVEKKVGYFCCQTHYEKYLESLSNEDYIKLQNSFCACSDE